MVTVVTQVYNTRPFLRQCIDSVINQTYCDFEFIIIDNGCTDGSSEIIQEYAQKDSRIFVISKSVNVPRCIWFHQPDALNYHKYLANIDSDDWWEPNYLECLVSLAETTGADIVCTGRKLHKEWTGQTLVTKSACRTVIDRSQFSEFFPLYRVFFSTFWMKIVRNEIMRSMDLDKLEASSMLSGFDYHVNIEWLRHANRICIDDSTLYHYRLRKDSFFHRYDPRKLDSDKSTYRNWYEFISEFGPISRQNEHYFTFLRAVLFQETMLNVSRSSLSPAEKMKEYRRIASDPQNADLGRWKHPYVRGKRIGDSLDAVLAAGSELDGSCSDDFREVMRILVPHCWQAATLPLCGLFADDKQLRNALLRDQPDELVELLVARIRDDSLRDEYDLGSALCAMAADHPTLHGISDTEFVRKFPDVYLALWRENYAQALERMTALLRDGQAERGTFMELYLSLAAIEKNYQLFLEGKDFYHQSTHF